MKKKVYVVITARPSYSRIRTTLLNLQNDKSINLNVILSGSATLPKFGDLRKKIKEDKLCIKHVLINAFESSEIDFMPKTVGISVIELSTIFRSEKPDVVITIADRFETIATAIAASYTNTKLIHIQGGERTGSIDDKVRNAISQLADYHCVSTLESALRLKSMFVDEKKIFNTGCPSIDLARQAKQIKTRFDPFSKYSGIGKEFDIREPYLVMLQHPVTTELMNARNQIVQTLASIKELGINTFVFWPNIDAGSDVISKELRMFRNKNSDLNIYYYTNIDGLDFLQLIKNSLCLIGNSSTGIRESSYLGQPVVNIGNRQENRERSSNVIDVPYCLTEIQNAIKYQIMNGKYKQSCLYGKGFAGRAIASIIKKIIK